MASPIASPYISKLERKVEFLNGSHFRLTSEIDYNHSVQFLQKAQKCLFSFDPNLQKEALDILLYISNMS